MTKLWISAGLQVNPNQSASYVKSALIELQKMTVKKEQGCIYFDVLQHADNCAHFTLWEEWINEAALTNHFNQPHTKAYLAQQLTEVLYIEKLVKLT
ncbi:MAG: quinol monooxygenase YgiN [Oceanospirillaceae bacterium]|jgi:quinol monooxygenase YgiN